MDFSSYAQPDENDRTTEERESHWQPALRPNDSSVQSVTPDLIESDIDRAQPSDEPVVMSQPFYHQGKEADVDSASDGEEDTQLDPAWGIKRTDSVHILDTIRRSTSFPRPVLDQALFSPPPDRSEFSHRQTSNENSHPGSALQFSPHVDLEEVRQDDGMEDDTLHSAHQLSNSISENPRVDAIQGSPDQEESRFDEGIPLIQESYTEEPPQAIPSHETFSAFEQVDAESSEADGFFAQIGSTPALSVPEHPTLERKDTDEVLNSLGVQKGPDDLLVTDEQNHTMVLDQRMAGKDFAAAFADVDDQQDDPWKAALGDDDDFLVEDADDLLPESDSEPDVVAPLPNAQPTATQTYRQPVRSNSNPYAPHQPSTSELAQMGSTTHQATSTRRISNPMNPLQPPQPPNITNRAASFADQAKDGYKSPYDLPMDLAPKRKVQAPRVLPQLNNIPPPPRSSSISTEKQLQSPFTPTPPSFHQSMGAAPLPRDTPPPASQPRAVSGRPQPPSKRMSSGFFEELPVAPRARPASTVPPRVPMTQTPSGAPQAIQGPITPVVASPPQVAPQPIPQEQDPYAQYQLRQPERLDPYASIAPSTTQPSQPVPVNSRYSPAPLSAPTGIKPTPSPRYSPAPPAQANTGHNRYVSQPVPPSAGLPFQPRTSSPLAQHRKSADRTEDAATQQRPGAQHSLSSSVPYAASFSQAAANTFSPPRAVDPTKQQGFVPPQRSQTQSPSRQAAKPALTTRMVPAPQRPATAFGQMSPTRTAAELNVLSPPRLVPQQRYVEEIDYIRPNDGTEKDPLERWKGTPIFVFGFGGAVVSSFPRRVPRFSSAATRPQMKVSPGEIVIKKLEEWIPLNEHVKKFPGPLKGKAKKKDVLTWLSSSISGFETQAMSFPSKQLEEKILLWKIVRILVEQDGSLDGPQAVRSASEILMPSAYTAEAMSPSQTRVEDIVPGIYRPASVSARTEMVDPVAVENLRKTLLKGQRQDAVWQAVDNRLWAHALLLSSTLDRSVWKQVVQEFVKQEVKTIGANAESLCALYEILGGNPEESVDQLVPPSARAGLQMVSKLEPSGPIRNALDGLDRWKETLCLVLNNRSQDDQRALVTLARLLSDYGRTEASHICYLFARNAGLPNMFGGADDLNTQIVLLGADHRQNPLTFHHDTDAIMLSEVLEFATTTLAASSAGAPMPHLAVYKLQRANELTDSGMKVEAQAYCDAVASGLKSNQKHSLYYNPLLLGEIEDLSNRLKQIPMQSSSWIAKPSIEKASNSVWNKFSSFVTGEDSDAESKGSARDAAEAGPFAKVSGSPTLSRNTSQTDLQNSYPIMSPVAPSTAAGSRYAPNGAGSTRSSSDLTRGRMSFEAQRSPPSTSHSTESRNLYAPTSQPQQQNHYSPLGMSPQVTGYQPSQEPYMPPVVEEISTSQVNAYMPQPAQTESMGYSPEPTYGGYQPVQPNVSPPEEPSSEPASTFEPPQQGYGGYEPPEDSGYVPYQPEPESDSEDSRPKTKTKSFMDDDGDDNFGPVSKNAPPSNRASPPISSGTPEAEIARRKANDEAAEAAFRAAAEADAKSAAETKSKRNASGSWLGGWFSGSKKTDSLDAGSSSNSKSSSTTKVHRVHLGESKMKLYYDENKKKWVNPDNPDASEKKTLAPPPRSSTGSAPPPSIGMAGPPRSVSTPHTLPAGGISRSGTPHSVAVDSEGPDSRPGSSHMGPSGSGFAATLPPGTKESLGLSSGTPTSLPTPPGSSGGPPGGSTSGPPSRPASALSNASGLDDLLGAPTGGRKVSGRGPKAKKGRYVDVMAK